MPLRADNYSLASEKITLLRLQRLTGSFELAFSVNVEVAPCDTATQHNQHSRCAMDNLTQRARDHESRGQSACGVS
jgi:hypothetical protein